MHDAVALSHCGAGTGLLGRWGDTKEDSIGLKLELRLQSLANRGAPLLRSTGSQYLVLARKRDACAPSIAPP